MRIYEKPTIKYRNLRSQRSIANVCWGNHDKYGPDAEYIYDHNGTELGFYGFRIDASGNGCDLNGLNVVYYANRTDWAAHITSPDPYDGYSMCLAWIHSVLKKEDSGGENYNPRVPGQGIEDYDPDDPS